jgi:hypothetical protein
MGILFSQAGKNIFLSREKVFSAQGRGLVKN